MIKLIAPYKINNIENGSMKDVIAFLDNTQYFGVDTETSGNFKLGVMGMNLAMLQIGNEYEQFVIDTRYNDVKILSKYFASKRILKIGHNLKFDAQVLKKHGIIMNNIYDTMVASMVVSTGLDEKHSLAECSLRYLDINIDSNQLNLFLPATSKATRNTFSNILYEDYTAEQVIYGAKDVEITCLLKHAINNVVEREKLSKVLTLENKFVLVLADMETAGTPINVTKWMNLISKAEDKAIELEEELNGLISEFSDPINWNSSKQVVKVFKHLGIPTQIVDKKSKNSEVTFKDSVGASAIKKYAMKFPIIAIYIRYKEYRKLYTSYGAKFLAKINPVTHRIHSNFIQILNTSRTASSNPNLQQLPRDKEYRECIEAKDGRTFIICDYSGQELHVVAHLSKDENMLNILRNKGDLHKATAAALYNISVEEVTKEQRQDGKTANFTIVYGGGAEKLAEVFGVPMSQARQMIERVFAMFPKLKPFQERSAQRTMENGFVTVDFLGRRSYIRDFNIFLEFKRMNNILGKNAPIEANIKTWVAKLRRLSANYPIQGSSAGMSKLAGIYLREYLLNNPGAFSIILLVHDEWVIECDIDKAEEAKKVLEECMSKAADYFCSSVSVPSEAIISKTWIK